MTNQTLPYDPITRDLARKASDDVSDAITRTVQLCDTADQAMVVALTAAGSAFAHLAGCIKTKYRCSDDEAWATAVSLADKREIDAIIAAKRHNT